MKQKHARKRALPEPPKPRREVPRVNADPEQGLSLHQVKERQQHGWANDPVESPTKTVGEIVRENVCTFFNFIFVVLAALLIAVGSFEDMLFLLIAAANTGIGIFQQLRSKQTIDKLNLLAAPRANVVREGNLISVPSAQLVRDDVAELSSGDQIPADATVLSGQIQVNEALITGEADAITKAPGDELLSGSFVVSGRCRARLDRVGAESYAARLTTEAKKDVTVGKSEMMSSLDKLIRVIGILLVPIGVALFVKEFVFLERTAQEAVISMVAALIGMIPEGLYLLTSVALAVSMLRLARGKVLAQDMNCIETLARVDVLCVDKTGTITEPHMEVGEVVYLDEEKYAETVVTETLNAFYQSMEADNDTARAMQQKFHGKSLWHAAQTIPFTSATKWSGAVFPGHGSFVVGAPEFIMGNRYADLKEAVDPWSEKGYRVLLAAEYDGVPDQKGLDPRRVSPMALIALSNRIRPAAPKTFRYFAEQGVAVKVISGDNPVTVAEVARQAEISGAEKYVDAATLQSDADFDRAVREYTVFGRVTPNQKRKLVRALQKQGHTVAMTGDGVNDVLALKDADCGIAMASGSDAACHAAQLVLLNSDFSAMPKVVAEGRRVINNIQRQRHHHRRALLLPGPGAQPQPGQGQIPGQCVPGRPARRSHRSGRGAGRGGVLPGVRLCRERVVHHVRHSAGGHRHPGALRGVQALRLEAPGAVGGHGGLRTGVYSLVRRELRTEPAEPGGVPGVVGISLRGVHHHALHAGPVQHGGTPVGGHPPPGPPCAEAVGIWSFDLTAAGISP